MKMLAKLPALVHPVLVEIPPRMLSCCIWHTHLIIINYYRGLRWRIGEFSSSIIIPDKPFSFNFFKCKESASICKG
jgi:hypothetical protein